MAQEAYFGFDVGTSSSKGVLVGPDGTVLRSASREHSLSRPRTGHVEMDAAVWWRELEEIAEELTSDLAYRVVAIGLSGMGPCVLVTDETGAPLRPAILYGIDTRATREIEELGAQFDADTLLDRHGSTLSTQAVGPKLAWLARHEPNVAAQARRLFMPATWLGFRLTGEYAIDYHSASQCTPLLDLRDRRWSADAWDLLAPTVTPPPLAWADEVLGALREPLSGIAAGTPVTLGSIDAWTEAVSVDGHRPGDLFLMYGTTMFLIATSASPMRHPSMWGTLGMGDELHCLAGGLATSGAITAWLREIFGRATYPALITEADLSGPGANGLLILPYFAGERTPVQDPDARGTILGLTTQHSRGDLYRAALEATAFAVRHNIETMNDAGATITRVVAAGGGTASALWPQIVSDVTGLAQTLPTVTMGASYGAARLAASAASAEGVDRWNPPSVHIAPNPRTSDLYDERYALYRELYPATRDITHRLVSTTS